MKNIFLFISALFFSELLFGQNMNKIHIGVSGDTKILMADGTEKKISEIKKGDVVKSYDINSSNFKNAKVKEVIKTGGDHIQLSFGNDIQIECSGNLPFLTKKMVGECKEVKINDSTYGFASTVKFKKIWAAYEASSEKEIVKLNIKDNLEFVSNSLEMGSIFLENIIPLGTLSARITYTLELESGNTFIANGFIVKCN